ncbi:MAG: hypothetical protein DMG05_20095 [Acidobacteria bacterium]|nr:MAG: hypothetical protein DMG05_20095 [Acidobacteriota bacterium]
MRSYFAELNKWRTPSFALVLLTALPGAVDLVRVIDRKSYYLTTLAEPGWQEFVGKRPYGSSLNLRFKAEPNPGEVTLFIRQRGVKFEWGVELNGRQIGTLFRMEQDLVHTLSVPPGTLRDGENTLSIHPPQEGDGIVVGEIQLDQRPLKEAVNRSNLEIRVVDSNSHQGLPCRITLVDREGALAPLYASPEEQLAIRPGVVYTGKGEAKIGVRPGEYTLYATRGFEYGLDSTKISIATGQTHQVRLAIRREVSTPGWVACDTHIHTLTHSGHGDATLDERMLTIAGEGIELPIATEHNVHIDYAAAARRVQVDPYFTTVTGNEVTTQVGHFNAFPIKPGSGIPDFHLENWPQLMESIRSTPRVQVVILNHPRDLHSNFRPFAETNFNVVSGENLRREEFSFDAVELVNSGALRSDLMEVYRDWFALLNHGYRIVGVGSSDCHDVSRYILGQGRTYVMANDADPASIDVDEVCRHLLGGRVLVSMGLLTQMTVDDKFGVGEMATGVRKDIGVTIKVYGPSWTSADKVELFSNGVRIREERMKSGPEGKRSNAKSIEKANLHWIIPRPAHDVYLVAIATGPGVTAPYWPIPRPYQPGSRAWQARVIGSTNPIWIDADGDGKYTSPRAYAKSLIERASPDPAKLFPALTTFDEAVAAQAASLCQEAGRDIRGLEFQGQLKTATESTQRGFKTFIQTLRTQ